VAVEVNGSGWFYILRIQSRDDYLLLWVFEPGAGAGLAIHQVSIVNGLKSMIIDEFNTFGGELAARIPTRVIIPQAGDQGYLMAKATEENRAYSGGASEGVVNRIGLELGIFYGVIGTEIRSVDGGLADTHYFHILPIKKLP
jgi:hypothetical protein